MTIVYGKCSQKIGAFNDAKHFVLMLDKVKGKNGFYWYVSLTLLLDY